MRPPAMFVGPRGLALLLLLAGMVGAAQRRLDSGLGGKPQPPPPVLPVTFNTTFSSFAVLQSAPAKSAVYGMAGAVALGVCVVRTAWLLFTVAAAPLVVCSDPSSPFPPRGGGQLRLPSHILASPAFTALQSERCAFFDLL